MKFLLAFAAMLAAACAPFPAYAASAYMLGPTISTAAGTVSASIAGTYNFSAGSTTVSTPTITLNGPAAEVLLKASGPDVQINDITSASTLYLSKANGNGAWFANSTKGDSVLRTSTGTKMDLGVDNGAGTGNMTVQITSRTVAVNETGPAANFEVQGVSGSGVNAAFRAISDGSHLAFAATDNASGGAGAGNFTSLSTVAPALHIVQNAYYGLQIDLTNDNGSDAANISADALVTHSGYAFSIYSQQGVDNVNLAYDITWPANYFTRHVNSLNGHHFYGPIMRVQPQNSDTVGAYMDFMDTNNNIISTFTIAGNLEMKYGVKVATLSVSGTTIDNAGYLAMGNAAGIQASLISTIAGLAPKNIGDIRFCSNCSPPKIVVATGTATGNWADAVGGTFK